MNSLVFHYGPLMWVKQVKNVQIFHWKERESLRQTKYNQTHQYVKNLDLTEDSDNSVSH